MLAAWIVMQDAAVMWAQDETASPPPEEGTATAQREPVAGEQPVTERTAGETPSTTAEPEDEAAGEDITATESADGLVSVDFKDADIRQVLRIISIKSGVDIVAGTDVEGLVTIKLTNVLWEQALDIILRTYGFTYERKGTIVRVMTVASQEQEALSTEVFPLDYARAKEVPDVIDEMLSDRGKIKFDERTNTIIVTDIPTNLFQIKTVIERLDTRTPQVLIESKIVETKLDKNENLGIDWSNLYSLTASASSIPSTFPFPGGAVFGTLGKQFIPRAGVFDPTTGAALTGGKVPSVGGTFTFGTLAAPAFAATMNFLQIRTDTHIVSNPTISALDNKEAKIHIGEEFPIPNYSIDQTTGRVTISGYTAKLLGTILTVTPHVNPSGEIVVDMKPEIVTAGANVDYGTGGGTVSLPRFTIQTAQTQVRIHSGETIAIGGLVKQVDTHKEEKVPLLGDIPLIGMLFKNNSGYTAAGQSDPARQDLLIFLTVKLMEEAPAKAQAVAAVAGPTAP